LSFGIIQELTKPGGKLIVWLYHPIPALIHNIMLFARRLTRHISVRIQFWIYFFTLLPLYLLVIRIKGKKMKWREIMIDLIDILTPYYRYEHEPQETECWYVKHGYENINVTDRNFFGFFDLWNKKYNDCSFNFSLLLNFRSIQNNPMNPYL